MPVGRKDRTSGRAICLFFRILRCEKNSNKCERTVSNSRKKIVTIAKENVLNVKRAQTSL